MATLLESPLAELILNTLVNIPVPTSIKEHFTASPPESLLLIKVVICVATASGLAPATAGVPERSTSLKGPPLMLIENFPLVALALLKSSLHASLRVVALVPTKGRRPSLYPTPTGIAG